MKKKLVAIISVCVLAIAIGGVAFMLLGGEDPHVHTFDQQSTLETYLSTNATCTQKAVYYYSCACGEKGTTTFEYGNALGHTCDQQKTTAEYLSTPATCVNKATYFYSCSCGEKGVETFEYGDALGHTYDQENTDLDYLSTPATCVDKATYFYSCVCGLKSTTTFETGVALEHDFKNYAQTSPATCENHAK